MNVREKSFGFALVAAVFLVAILGALALTIAAVSKVQQDTGVKSLLTDKVFYGARAGLEWGLQRAVAASSCSASTTFSLTGPVFCIEPGTPSTCVSVTVECSQSAHGTASDLVFYLKSTATRGAEGSFDRAERVLEATVSNIP